MGQFTAAVYWVVTSIDWIDRPALMSLPVNRMLIRCGTPRFACMLLQSGAARARQKKGEHGFADGEAGGVDGTRTRDPRRDRPVF